MTSAEMPFSAERLALFESATLGYLRLISFQAVLFWVLPTTILLLVELAFASPAADSVEMHALGIGCSSYPSEVAGTDENLLPVLPMVGAPVDGLLAVRMVGDHPIASTIAILFRQIAVLVAKVEGTVFGLALLVPCLLVTVWAECLLVDQLPPFQMFDPLL